MTIYDELRQLAGPDHRAALLVSAAGSVLSKHSPEEAATIGAFALSLVQAQKRIRDDQREVLIRITRQELDRVKARLGRDPRIAGEWAPPPVAIWGVPTLLAASLRESPTPRSRRPGTATDHELFAGLGLMLIREALGWEGQARAEALMDAALCILPVAGPKTLPNGPEREWLVMLKANIAEIDAQLLGAGKRPLAKLVYDAMEERHPGYSHLVNFPRFSNLLKLARST